MQLASLLKLVICSGWPAMLQQHRKRAEGRTEAGWLHKELTTDVHPRYIKQSMEDG